jgi:PAS domain S-box-containing protein
MSDLDTQENSTQSLGERVIRAVQRGQSLERVATALQGQDLLRTLAQVSADQSLDARLRLATLNLMQDAIAARRGEQEQASERALAQDALRVSEQRFRQFGDASSDVLWIRDAGSLRLEFVSTAFEQVFGANARCVQLRGIEDWAALIVPDDRQIALRNVTSVQQGNPIVEEFRIQRPSDRAFRWIHSTAFPMRDSYGRVQRIAGISRDVTETKQLFEHQATLVAELQHRVRNIMAMIRAMASRMAETSRDVEHYSEALIGRLMALARTQSLLTRAGSVGVDVRTIVITEISAQALSDQFELIGPTVALSPKAAEVLTLVVHELTTNALKYGAFATERGRLSVEWQVAQRGGQPSLWFHWKERCEALAPGPKGFGSELIERRVPYELKGEGRLVISASGAECTLVFPLNPGSSILETDSPSPSSVHGGSIDMQDAPRLENLRVLVVEDDFYLAGDAERALRGAGAVVEGPYHSQSQAEDAVARRRPDCAVIDINLGSGPSFELAKQLRLHKVPFVFLTGYAPNMIPVEFSDVQCLHKPIGFGDMVQSIADLIRHAA